MKLVEITLAGFKRLVPEALLDAYRSFGWKSTGADRLSEETKSPQPKVKSKKRTKNESQNA